MKDSFLYPILFMLILVVIFVGVLAVMYRSSEARILAYNTDVYQKIVLRLLSPAISQATGKSTDEINQAYPEAYALYVQEIKPEGLDRRAFKAVDSDSTLAYCFEIGGKGLWGTMKALISTTTDLQTLVDFAIVNQMETPGLGARIEEDWFLGQFRNRQMVLYPENKDDVTASYEFIAESQTPEHDRQLRRVTGATITSDSVIRMLKNEINHIFAFARDHEL